MGKVVNSCPCCGRKHRTRVKSVQDVQLTFELCRLCAPPAEGKPKKAKVVGILRKVRKEKASKKRGGQ